MRLIDADALAYIVASNGDADFINKVTRLMIDAPSIDIERCGECRCWIDDRKSEDDMGTCGLTHFFTNPDDFCSYGEREERSSE